MPVPLTRTVPPAVTAIEPFASRGSGAPLSLNDISVIVDLPRVATTCLLFTRRTSIETAKPSTTAADLVGASDRGMVSGTRVTGANGEIDSNTEVCV